MSEVMISLAPNQARSTPGINPHNPAGGPGDYEEGQPGGEDCPPVELPLGTDVPELHTKRDRDTEAGEQEGSSLDQSLRDSIPVTEGAGEHRRVDLKRVLSSQEEDDPSKHEREQE